MRENMQPLEAFVKEYVKGGWKADKEYILYNHPSHRFRLIVESPDRSIISDGFIGLWRQEELGDEGINVDCDDAKEFAQKLVETMFYHLSPHEMMHVIDALEADLEKWFQERKAMLGPEAGDKRCPY